MASVSAPEPRPVMVRVRLHGGTIEAVPRPDGRGTTMRVRVELHRAGSLLRVDA